MQSSQSLRTRILIASALLIATSTSFIFCTPRPSREQRLMESTPAQTYQAGTQDTGSTEELLIAWYRVIDGDTIEVNLVASKAFRISVTSKCRVYGVDTPEKTTEAGKALIECVQSWLDRQDHLRAVFLKEDKFGGRFIGEVHGDSESLSNFLLSNKLAKPYKGEKKQPWTEAELAEVLSNSQRLR